MPLPLEAESTGWQNECLKFKQKKIRSSALPNCHITEPNLSYVMWTTWKEGKPGLADNPVNSDHRGKNSAVKLTLKKSSNATIKHLKVKIQYLPVYDNTLLRTPWTRVFLEKVTGFQLVKKFPAF